MASGKALFMIFFPILLIFSNFVLATPTMMSRAFHNDAPLMAGVRNTSLSLHSKRKKGATVCQKDQLDKHGLSYDLLARSESSWSSMASYVDAEKYACSPVYCIHESNLGPIADPLKDAQLGGIEICNTNDNRIRADRRYLSNYIQDMVDGCKGQDILHAVVEDSAGYFVRTSRSCDPGIIDFDVPVERAVESQPFKRDKEDGVTCQQSDEPKFGVYYDHLNDSFSPGVGHKDGNRTTTVNPNQCVTIWGNSLDVQGDFGPGGVEFCNESDWPMQPQLGYLYGFINNIIWDCADKQESNGIIHALVGDTQNYIVRTRSTCNTEWVGADPAGG